MPSYQAVLVLSFGGPEKAEDVLPFLENVSRGRNVPKDRLLEVAEHYYHFGGRSPLNDQNRQLIAALSKELEHSGLALPIYWGNRNWSPYLTDTVRAMTADGIERAVVFVTSAFGSYSGCRQYLEDIERAHTEVGPGAPQLHKLRVFYNHPGFIACIADRTRQALEQLPHGRRSAAGLMFTAHSIPASMAESSPYSQQLTEACGLVAAELGREQWQLVFQSRSGPPNQPWLEPDIADALRRFRDAHPVGADVVVSPIGFISDHMEVVYDLDTEALQVARNLGLNMVRASTPGTHPRFIRMIRELIVERVQGLQPAVAAGSDAAPDFCAASCCPPPGPPAASHCS
jgi:ferrochelatase